MKYLKKIYSLVKKLLRGQDVILVPQTTTEWNEQYRNGVWDRIVTYAPNTGYLNSLICAQESWGGTPLNVLDVGCGNGALAEKLFTSGKNINYTGLDVSEEAITQAEKRSPAGRYYIADAKLPPTDFGPFDAIVFNEVLYYTDPRATLKVYRQYAHSRTKIYVSVMRFKQGWRSWFLWRRIWSALRPMKKTVVKDKEGRVWDIAIATF